MRALNIFIMLITLLCSTASNADVILRDLEGKTIELSSLKGKWVFINYWATWCGPCVDEISEFNRFYKKNKNVNVAVFAVNYDPMPVSKQKVFMKQFNIHYPGLTRNSARALHFRNAGVVPVTYVLNPQGELSTTLYGGQTVASLKEAMQ